MVTQIHSNQAEPKEDGHKNIRTSTASIQKQVEEESTEAIELVRRPQHPTFSIKHTKLKDLEEDNSEDIIDPSLPKDKFSAEDFQEFWTSYLNKLKKSNKPAYNVLETADWRITTDYNIALTFDSSVMVLEFDKLREDFLKRVRKKLNNFHIRVEPQVSASTETVSHIKSRKEIFQDMVKENPLIDKLRIALGLDLENEP